MKKLGIVLVLIAICLFGLTAGFAEQSFDKYNHYVSSDFFGGVNAYVGGDAYNYIINGTYFTGFAIYAAASAIGGIICLVAGIGFVLVSVRDNKNAKENGVPIQRKNIMEERESESISIE